MRKKRRIEIRIQTRQTLRVERSANVTREWCPECREEVEMIRVEKATALDAESLHTIETAGGSLLVCLNSLIE